MASQVVTAPAAGLSMANTESDNPYVQASYLAKTPEEMVAAYKEWSLSYDKHMVEIGYVAPGVAASVAAKYAKLDGTILDAGCGSGISGVALAKVGATTIEGVDLSAEMLKVADQTTVYRDLQVSDLNRQVNKVDNSYDAIVCVGTFTNGHVGPYPALEEFARITKPGGSIVASILPQLWKPKGFEAEVQRLEQAGKVKCVSNEVKGYRRGQDAHFTVLTVL